MISCNTCGCLADMSNSESEGELGECIPKEVSLAGQTYFGCMK